MDRVTRYPIFSIPHSPRVAGLGLEEGTGYTFELVDVGPEASSWDQDQPQARPADREAWPNAAGRKASWSPCAFPEARGRPSPWRLCWEGDKDKEAQACHLDTGATQPTQPRSLEQERRAVIQGQALRKGGTVATLRGSLAPWDPRSPGQAPSGPLEEHTVDREQIDFLAARQQFVSLEQAGARAPPNLPAGVAPVWGPPGIRQAPKAPAGPPLANGYAAPLRPQVTVVVTGDKGAAGAQAVGDRSSQSPGGSPEPPGETPIEREIRLAQEREAALREQRGLRQAASQQELVEIPARPLLAKVSLASSPRRDRGRPSLYVRRDLAQETQREEDHRRREGLKAGQPSAPTGASVGPQPALKRALSSDCILGLAPEAGAARPAAEVRREDRPAHPAFHAYGKPGGPSAEEAKAVSSPKAAGPQWHLSESSGKPPGAKSQCSKPREGPPRAHGGVIRRECFRLQPLRFRVPEGPLQAEVRSPPGWEVGGILASRLQRSPSSELLEKEVESVLQREREVAAERRLALFPEVFSPPPEEEAEEAEDSRSSSAASGVTGSYSVSESHFFVSPIHLSGVAETEEAPAKAAPEQEKRKEQRYASISASDHINSEVLEATRVTRHTNAKARCWEARICASEGQG
ncbi:mitotic interactor and substrate of PLK1 [Suricata suricatta]|uniref:Mitotic spindle positioning n=1 Tax=Suricata suricatta TaxID=37032 RepID=A0A673TMK4_SURSU|nr:mitotic interactor and substrate of PLK1 [Suricata suricatta]XP_029773370.1 mitotic interactor and substrate of PLK1 [Suricata suricatta]XP_029773371.1 mitotic interactor and substrate of PLK1 [Suricata suricatta]